MSIMLEIAKETKSAAILEAAFKTFVSYGFKRTKMDDIAQAAGMSRPALYLVYKNKQDIFRACMIALMEVLEDNLSRIVSGEGEASEKIRAILQKGIVEPHLEIGTTPHADEIFALKSEIAADLFVDWMAMIENALTRTLADAASKGELNLGSAGVEAKDIAAIITDSTEGIKLRMESPADLEQKLDALVKLMIGPLETAK